MRAVGLVQEVSRPALPQAVCLALQASERPMALRPAAEPVLVRRQCPVQVESPDVHSALNLRGVAASRRERPVRPEDAVPAQSKAHRPAASRSTVLRAVSRSMVLQEAWCLALALHLEAEPRVQAVAAQSEQPLVLVVPSELRPVAVEAVVAPPLAQQVAAEAEQPSAGQAEVAARPLEARVVAEVRPSEVRAVEAEQPLAQQAAAEQDAQPVAEAARDVLQVEEAARDARRVAAAQVQPWEARVEQPSAARPWVAPSRRVLRLARRRTTMLPARTFRHAPEAAKVGRPRLQSSSAE